MLDVPVASSEYLHICILVTDRFLAIDYSGQPARLQGTGLLQRPELVPIDRHFVHHVQPGRYAVCSSILDGLCAYGWR